MRLRREKNITKIFVALFAVTMMLMLGGCGEKKQLTDVSFLEDTVTIERYETYSLGLIGAEEKEIEWKSDDKSVATVENGVVYAKKKGNTRIYANIDDAEISCEVVVLDNQYIPVINLNEPNSLNLGKGENYRLRPSLSYNSNTYNDATYTYTAEGNSLEVNEEGLITATDLGQGLICVKAKWRDVEIDTSLTINVIDASTSIEVSAKSYDIYLNGAGEEYPARADLGITIYDDNQLANKKISTVKYKEQVEDGDVKGAATIASGIVYPSKLGTTHFVAEYQSEAGVTVRSTTFAVNVLQTPEDKYMTPIEGEKFTFFFEPLGANNWVEWDEELKAFHLINNTPSIGDDSGFIINKSYLEKIMTYTDARSIEFEVLTDGIASGAEGSDRGIYQAFYPNWLDGINVKRYELTDVWKKVEIYFDEIPKDEEGNLKAIYLMNTMEGMYVRNIALNLPPTGKITKIDLTENNLVWTHGADTGLAGGNNKGIVTNRKGVITIRDCYVYAMHEMEFLNIDNVYAKGNTLRMKIKATPNRKDMNNLVLGFYNYDTVGEIGDSTTPCITRNIKAQGEWVTIELDMDMFLNKENRFVGLTVVTFGYNNWDSGEMYTFQIKDMEVIGDVTTKKVKEKKLKGPITDIDLSMNNVSWSSGADTGLTGGHNLGAISYNYETEILKIADCFAYATHEMEFTDLSRIYASGGTIRMTLKATPSKKSMSNLKLNFFNYDAEGRIDDESTVGTSVLIKKKGEWVTVDLDLDLFLNKKNKFTGLAFATFGYNDWNSGEMYTIEIKDMKVYGKYTIDTTKKPEPEGPITKIDISNKNVSWTHGADTGLTGGHNLGTFSYDNETGILKIADGYVYGTHEMEFADLTKIYQSGGTLRLKVKATPNRSGMSNMKLYFYNYETTGGIGDSAIQCQIKPVKAQGEWVTLDLDLDMFLNSKNQFAGLTFVTFGYNDWTTGEMYTIEIKDMEIYGKYTVVEEEEPEKPVITGPITKIDLSDANVSWNHGADTGLTGGHNLGTVSYDSETGVMKLADCYAYAMHEMIFADLSKKFAAGGTLRMQVKATPNGSSMNNLTLNLYNCDTTGRIDESTVIAASEVIKAQGEWVTIEVSLDSFLNSDNQFTGLTLVTFGYNDWNSGEMYTVEIKEMEVVGELITEEGTEPTGPVTAIDIGTSNVSWTHGADTGVTGGHNLGNISYDEGSGILKLADCYAYATHEMTFADVSKKFASGGTLQMKVKASPNSSDMSNLTLYFYNAEATGGIDEATTTRVVKVIESQGSWVTIQLNLDMFLDANGKFTGLTIVTFGYSDWSSGEMYTIEIKDVEVIGEYTEEEKSLLRFDVTATTIDNTTENIRIYFYNHSYTGRVDGEPRVEKIIPANGEKTVVELDLEDFLVDGKMPGFGFTVQSGPAWDSPTNDRTTLKIENVQVVDGAVNNLNLNTAIWSKGTETGITDSNNWGSCSCNEGVVTISNIICFDAHEVTFSQTEEIVGETIDLSETNLTWTHGADTGLTGGHGQGTLSYGEGFQIADCFVFGVHEMKFADKSKTYMANQKLRVEVKATPNLSQMNNLILNFYHHETTGGIGDSNTECISKAIEAQGEWVTVEMDLNVFLDSDGTFAGLAFATFGYQNWESGEMYTLEIRKIEIL